MVGENLLDGGGSGGPGSLVNGYTLQVLGLEATIRALDAANSIVGRALADASGAAIKKGQQQKVDF